MKTNPALAPLDRAVGKWTLTGSHPYFPGRTFRGETTFERCEQGAFLRMHSKMQDPEIPEGVAIFGTDGDVPDRCTMLYFDERGVARRYEIELHEDGFTWSRESPSFAQRFRVTFADGDRMESVGTMSKDGGPWEPDLRLTYVRIGS